MVNFDDLFDALLEADTRNQKRGELRQLEQKIDRHRCGDCSKWMIKSLCKPEASGRFITCDDRICSEFSESGLSAECRQKWREHRDALKAELGVARD